MKKPKHSIQHIFLANVLIFVGLLLTLQAALNVVQIKESMEAQVRETLEARTQVIAGDVNRRLFSFKMKVEGFALGAASLPHYEEAPLRRMLFNDIRSDTMIVGGGYWFAPYVYDPEKKFFCGYYERGSREDLRPAEGYMSGNYDYTNTDWYRSGLNNLTGAAWTGPYRDEVTGILMLTVTSALWRNGVAEGCVTLDIGLSELEDYIQDIRIGKNGRAFFVREDGQTIGLPDEEKEIRRNILEGDDQSLVELGKKIVAAREVEIFETEVRGRETYIIATPLSVRNLKLVLLAPKSDYTDIIWRYVCLTGGMVLLVIVGLVFAIHIMFQRRVYRPIRELVSASEIIANGGNADIRTHKQDELGYLAESIYEMSCKLQRRNEQLRDRYQELEDKNRALEVALANVESMRVSRDNYKVESETDKLTGLLNKAATERLAGESLMNAAEGRLAALYIIDLDHFKEANDTCGHTHGDRILQQFSSALRHSFRPTDIIGRFGGDEFIVLLTGLPGRKIVEQKARQILKAARNLEVGGESANVTASIGVALCPLQGTTYEELFAVADQCLYKVKEQGRNGCCIAMEEMIR